MTLYTSNSLQTLLVTLVLISLTAYNFLALYQLLKEKSVSSILFIEHMFSFSLLWLTESLFIVFFYLYFFPYKTHFITFRLLPPVAFFSLLALSSTLYYFWAKKQSHISLKVTFLFINICLALTLFFKFPLLIALKFTILIYMVIYTLYTYFAYKLIRKISLIRVFYTAFCIIVLVIISLLEDRMLLSFYLTINLCLCFFLTISFCLYHAEIYTSKLIYTTKDANTKKSELLEAEKRIQYLAYTHPDTGLKNAHKLHVDLKNIDFLLTGACMLNIKNFKLLLTLIGYRESKSILDELSKTVMASFKSQADMYHFSTDRFIILYKEEPDKFETFIKNILSTLAQSNLCAIDLNPCIGATYIKSSCLNYETLIQELELASHVSKHTPEHYALYVSDMSKTLQEKLNLEGQLREAASQNLWDIYLQPKVNVINNQIIGAEALIRWRGNETAIPPNVFIPLAERLGLISKIGRYVIETTFRYVHELEQIGFDGLRFSINLSVQQFMEIDLVNYIKETAEKYNISPSSIIFEITESILIHNMSKVNSTIMQLKELGFRFSLDDFGTGYSSLAYLSKLSLDEIKFDREFIKNIKSEDKNRVILECVTRMGQTLGLDIVTEGIEDELQYNTIKSLGCNYYQGYYYSKPIPFQYFLNLLSCPGV